MRYFFNFETFSYGSKIGNKELFYLRLLKKRMKEDYEIYREPHPLISHIYCSSGNNMFCGNILEFGNTKSFSKFKLDYGSLLNPKIKDWKRYLRSIKSFEVEDDFVEQAARLAKEREKAYEAIIFKKDNERIYEHYNSTIDNLYDVLNRSMFRINDGIIDVRDNMFINKSMIKSIDDMKQNIDSFKKMLSNVGKFVPTMPVPNWVPTYSDKDIVYINKKYEESYLELYKNVRIHDIP